MKNKKSGGCVAKSNFKDKASEFLMDARNHAIDAGWRSGDIERLLRD